MRTYYFGCWGGYGHYLWQQNGRHPQPSTILDLPWKEKDLDCTLCPRYQRYSTNQQNEGEALLHHKNGWTALAFWDRSIDKRHGSNSVLLIQKEVTLEEAIEIFKQEYPSIWSRFNFTIKLYETKDTTCQE